MFKPSWVIIPGPDGVMTRKYRRQLYWQCDVDPRGGHILTQTRLSFNRTTSVQVQQGGGDTRGGDNNSFVSTPTEGQPDADVNNGK